MYEFNEEAARKADNTGAFITEMGKYEGKIVQAYVVNAKSGARGVGFEFEAGGQSAKFTLYTHGRDGNEIMGLDQLNAFMRCVGQRALAPTDGKIKRWDRQAKADVFEDGQVFKTLAGKPIGIVFETEGNIGENGQEYSRVVPKIFFQAGTGLTASELVDKKTVGTKLDKIVASLRHRPAKARTGAAQGQGPSPQGGFDGDDIPF